MKGRASSGSIRFPFFVVMFGLGLVTAASAQEPGWIADKNGCRVWDSTPVAGESVSWSGHCTDGLADGSGILVWYENGRPGETYEGTLSRGHYTGHGTQVWPGGNKYEGDYVNDQADGWGTYTFANGAAYSGKWVKGCFQGGQHLAVGAQASDCR